jgi:hypothetical protein
MLPGQDEEGLHKGKQYQHCQLVEKYFYSKGPDKYSSGVKLSSACS